MSRSAPALPRPPRRRRSKPTAETQPAAPPVAYGQAFWMAYVSNLLAAIATALLYRYSDFLTLLGGNEFHLGWIVGVGMIGSLLMRLSLGSCIDNYGTKLVWLGSTLLFAAACFAHLAVVSHTGAAIYVLRVLFCVAVAGIVGASTTFVSKSGPTERMAELVGMLGTSGFLGIVGGTLLGDFLLGSVTVDRHQVEQMFIAAGVLGLLSYPFAWLATRGEVWAKPLGGSSLVSVLRRHHPGPVLVICVAMGLGLGLPCVFLRTYAADLDIPRIGLFFFVYCVAAIVTRLITRRWPERFGTRRLIVVSMVGLVGAMLLFLPVHREWHLVLPAVGFGCSHAILFPAVIAAGSVTFPARHRGLAMVLVLAAYDVGQLIGAPTAGAVLRYSPSAGLPPYPTMFLTMAGLLAAAGGYYAAVGRR